MPAAPRRERPGTGRVRPAVGAARGRAFLRLQGADRIDQPPAGPEQRGRGVQQALLPGGECGDVARAASGAARRDGGGWCRWRCTAHRAARRRTERGGARRRRPPATTSRCRRRRARFSRKRRDAGWVALDGDDLRAGGRELRGLAAGCGAEIGDPLARLRREQPRGQGGGGVLDPERALGEPRQLVTRVPGGKRTEPVGSTDPPSGAARAGTSVRSSGASACAPRRSPARPGPRTPRARRRIEPRTVQLLRAPQARPWRPGAVPRSPARRRASACGRARGRRGGDRPHGRASRAAAARPRRGGACAAPGQAARDCRNGSSTASSVPVRRSTAAASRCPAARSRASIGGRRSSASSSVQWLSSTAVSSSKAQSREGSAEGFSQASWPDACERAIASPCPTRPDMTPGSCQRPPPAPPLCARCLASGPPTSLRGAAVALPAALGPGLLHLSAGRPRRVPLRAGDEADAGDGQLRPDPQRGGGAQSQADRHLLAATALRGGRTGDRDGGRQSGLAVSGTVVRSAAWPPCSRRSASGGARSVTVRRCWPPVCLRVRHRCRRDGDRQDRRGPARRHDCAMGLLARAYLRLRPLPPEQAAAFWLAIGAGILIKGPVTPDGRWADRACVDGCRSPARWGWMADRVARRPGACRCCCVVVLPWFRRDRVCDARGVLHGRCGRRPRAASCAAATISMEDRPACIC